MDDPDTEVNLGCLLFKEGQFQPACQKFQNAMQILGYRPGEFNFPNFSQFGQTHIHFLGAYLQV